MNRKKFKKDKSKPTGKHSQRRQQFQKLPKKLQTAHAALSLLRIPVSSDNGTEWANEGTTAAVSLMTNSATPAKALVLFVNNTRYNNVMEPKWLQPLLSVAELLEKSALNIS